MGLGEAKPAKVTKVEAEEQVKKAKMEAEAKLQQEILRHRADQEARVRKAELKAQVATRTQQAEGMKAQV